ncbi:MAG: carboxypeptidase regulatory-like domain-containing protein, partial [Planctomycetota bacterium]|nr:carboxypeptidase regulatory-like domain-containing protein [Planctomycetota bacterium]
GYDSPTNWVNIAKTGGLLVQQRFVGDTAQTTRVTQAITYIDNDWAQDNLGNYYAMYGVMKGMRLLGVTTLPGGRNWYNEYATYLLGAQYSDGTWPGGSWSDTILSTAWAIAIFGETVFPIEVDIVTPLFAFKDTTYSFDVNYRVTGISVDGSNLKVYKGGNLFETVAFTSTSPGLSGTRTYTYTDTTGTYTYRALLTVVREDATTLVVEDTAAVFVVIPGTITGTVSAGGAPVSNTLISYRTLFSAEGGEVRVSVQGITYTNNSGGYTLLLPAGSYDMLAIKQGYVTQTATAVPVTATETTTQNFVFPSPPALVTSPVPNNGATSVPITQTLSWASATGASSYDVYFGQTLALVANITETSFSPGTMGWGITSYWRIDSRNDAGATTGTLWSFTTISAPPGDEWDATDGVSTDGTWITPTDSTQSHGPHTLSASDLYDWFRINMTTGYTYYFNTSGGSGDNYGELFSDSAGTNRVAGNNDAGGNGQFSFFYTAGQTATYYLKIRVYSGGNWSGYVNYYSVAPAPAAQVLSPNPANNATGVPLDAQLYWASAAGAASYDVYFATTTTGWSAVLAGTTLLQYTSALTYNTTYFWRVDSINPVGTVTTGTLWSFTTRIQIISDAWDTADDTATSGTLITPITTTLSHSPHTLSASDLQDWYRVNMTAGRTYYFDTTGGQGNNYGELYSDSGGTNMVAYDDDSGGNGQFSLSYTAQETRTYYLKVRHYTVGGSWSGSLNYRCFIPPVGFVSGTVSTTGGAPISGAVLEALLPAGGGSPLATTTTAVSGTYQLQLPVGTYNIRASKLGYLTQVSQGVSVLEGQTTTVTFTLTAAPPPKVNVMPNIRCFTNTALVIWGNVRGNSAPYNYNWNLGNGTVITGTVDNPRYIPVDNYIYTTTGTYSATLTITDCRGMTSTDTVVIQVMNPTILSADAKKKIEIDIAVAKGLRALYLSQNLENGSWSGYYGYTVGPTAQVVLAFENRGHLPTNDIEKDIYAEYVQKGLDFLFNNAYSQAMAVQPA